jgi:hypothetical protein
MGCVSLQTFVWPVGQVVKTPPFHGGNRGSSPLRVILYLAVVVERQTHHLEGVALTRRGGSNPPDRIPFLKR